MGRFAFLMFCLGLLLPACDKEAEVKSSADANADLNGASAQASATAGDDNPEGFQPYGGDHPSANAPGLACWTPAGLIEVEPGDTLVMDPGAGCDPHPSTNSLKVAGGGPFSVKQFNPGARIIFQPDGKSCDPAEIKADLGYSGATVGLAFKVVQVGCEGD